MDIRPSQWLHSYRTLVRSNAATVTQVESTLRSVVYLLPGSFHKTPIAAESLHTGLNLLSALHTAMMAPHSSCKLAPQRRYDLWAGAKSSLYGRALTLLRTIQYTQLLLEMAAKRVGERARWRIVVALEFIKAVCRFLLLRLSGTRPSINTDLTTRNMEERQAPIDELEEDPRPLDLPYKMPRTGYILSPMPAGQTASQFLDAHVLTSDQVKPAHQLVHRLQSLQAVTAESLWILRPLCYALVLQYLHEKHGRRDWRPWLVGAGMELLSQELSKRSVAEEVHGGWRGLSSIEREESSRRDWSMAWWTMRGAFHERITGRWLRGIAQKGRGKWGLDLLAGIVDDYDWMWSEHFYATATS